MLSWSTFINRFRRSAPQAEPSVDHRVAAWWEQTQLNLAARRANRAALSVAAKRGVDTKVHQAYQNDALLHGRVQL